MRRGRSTLLGCLVTAALSFGLGAAQEAADADETLLRSAGLPTDGAGLIDFFHKRSLKAAERSQLEDLVKKLDDRAYKVRTDASAALVLRGRPALPFLKQVVK